MRERPSIPAIARALAALTLAVTAVAVSAGSAAANTTQPTMLQDDAQLVTVGQPQRDRRLDELKRIGVDIVKVRVNWRSVAPSPRSRKKPKGFDGSNPNAYPSGRWDAYDAVVRGAAARGMQVFMQLGGQAPEWATPGKRRSAVYAPSAREFGAFVKAVGTRYSGSFGGTSPGGGGLPIPLPGGGAPGGTPALSRVSIYSVWNEPNLVSWLAPQFRRGVPYAPTVYRRLLYAASDALSQSGHGSDQLLIGELLPFARSGRTGGKKMRPLAFLRELACVSSRFRPYRGRAAKKRGCSGRFRTVPGTGLAFHPYTLAGGPNIRTPNRDDASIATLGRVTRTLDRLSARKRLARRRMPLWISEFGFQSSPPDRYATRIRRIPGFMAQSERIAFHNGRVASYAQYPLVDDPALGGFQSGLRFKSGKAKPRVYSAFRHTIYVVRRGGARVEVFGCERAAGSGNVTVESRRGRKGKWQSVATVAVNGAGYFDRVLRLSGAARRQYRYSFGGARSRTATPARR